MLSLLAATLAVASAGPAFAGKPGQVRLDGRQEHEQDANAGEKRRGGKSQGDGANAKRTGAHSEEPDLSTEARGKGKNKGGKTVKRTFSNDAEIEIPAVGTIDDFGPADPYPSSIQVTGFKKARITDLNLALRGFSHVFTRDVDVLLVAPGGRNAVVLGDVGGNGAFSGVSDLTITLDDEAAGPPSVADNVSLSGGTFQPLDNLGLIDEAPSPGVILDFPAPAPTPSGSNALSTFDGIDPNGQWRLFVLDDAQGDVGSFADGWSLQITAKNKTKKKRR